jgi:hypothetical protein
MLKALKSCLVLLSSIIILSTSVHAVSREEYISHHENSMITLCEDIYGDRDGVYGCLITEYYAIRKVSGILITMRRSGDDWDFLVDLFTENSWPEYETFDFMVIHLGFEEYLEEKEARE